MTFCKSFIDELNEATTTSVVRRNKATKRNAMAGRSALSICRSQNPALYKKYKTYRERYLKVREMILKKYKVRGTVAARKKIR